MRDTEKLFTFLCFFYITPPHTTTTTISSLSPSVYLCCCPSLSHPFILRCCCHHSDGEVRVCLRQLLTRRPCTSVNKDSYLMTNVSQRSGNLKLLSAERRVFWPTCLPVSAPRSRHCTESTCSHVAAQSDRGREPVDWIKMCYRLTLHNQYQ